MKLLAEAACAHLDTPGIAEPFLRRALEGIARIEAIAGEFQAEVNRLRALSDQIEAIATQNAMLQAREAFRLGDSDGDHLGPAGRHSLASRGNGEDG